MNTIVEARRRATLALPGLLAATAGRAQAPWPDRPVRLLVGYPPGGPTDFIGRLAAAGLQAAWGQTVVVENRPGASSSVAAEAVSRAAPDGLTLLLAVNALVLNAAIHPNPPYALPDSFAPVGTFCTAPNLFWCAANQPWRDLQAVAAAARAAPGALAYGTTGVGGTGHFGGETVCRALGISLAHVPYRGTAPLMQDVAGGRVPLLSHGITGLVGPLQSGLIRARRVGGRRRATNFLARYASKSFAEEGLHGHADLVPVQMPIAAADAMQRRLTPSRAPTPPCSLGSSRMRGNH